MELVHLVEQSHSFLSPSGPRAGAEIEIQSAQNINLNHVSIGQKVSPLLKGATWYCLSWGVSRKSLLSTIPEFWSFLTALVPVVVATGVFWFEVSRAWKSSAGVLSPRVCRGRSLSSRSTLSRSGSPARGVQNFNHIWWVLASASSDYIVTYIYP
jgi:hypothetical protein